MIGGNQLRESHALFEVTGIQAQTLEGGAADDRDPSFSDGRAHAIALADESSRRPRSCHWGTVRLERDCRVPVCSRPLPSVSALAGHARRSEISRS